MPWHCGQSSSMSSAVPPFWRGRQWWRVSWRRVVKGRSHRAQMWVVSMGSFLAGAQAKDVEPLVRLEVDPAEVLRLGGPQAQAEQQRLAAEQGPAGDQHPARRLPLR